MLRFRPQEAGRSDMGPGVRERVPTALGSVVSHLSKTAKGGAAFLVVVKVAQHPSQNPTWSTIGNPTLCKECKGCGTLSCLSSARIRVKGSGQECPLYTCRISTLCKISAPAQSPHLLKSEDAGESRASTRASLILSSDDNLAEGLAGVVSRSGADG